MKKILLSSLVVAISFAMTNLDGIRKAPLSADSQNLEKFHYSNAMPIPGQVETIKKSFVSAPPMIPHKVDNMLPIKFGENECLSCHMPATAKALGIKGMPKDHFKDNFDGDIHQKHRISGSRYNCTQCHAPQANVDPVVENKFESLRK